MERPWINSVWDCFTPIDTCLLGTFCPCFLFGRTQARVKGEIDPSGCNMECCAWYCLLHCYASQCLQAIKRTDMRSKYHLEGNCLSDWALTCCCTCCALVQEEKESLLKEHNEKQAYTPPQGMTYGNPATAPGQSQYPRQGHSGPELYSQQQQQQQQDYSGQPQYPQQPKQAYSAGPIYEQYPTQTSQGYPTEK